MKEIKILDVGDYKVPCIKRLRETTNLGIKEAKDIVEAMMGPWGLVVEDDFFAGQIAAALVMIWAQAGEIKDFRYTVTNYRGTNRPILRVGSWRVSNIEA